MASAGDALQGQLQQLARKLEHVQMDVNSLRDNLVFGGGGGGGSGDDGLGVGAADGGGAGGVSPYRPSSPSSSGSYYAQIPTSAWSQATKTLSQLRSDLEGMRLLVRRVEVHQSVELNVFSQLRELQRFSRGLQRLVDERAPANSIRDLSDKLEREMSASQADAATKAQRAAAELERMREAMMDVIPAIAREQSQVVYDANAALVSYVPSSEYAVAMDDVGERLEKFARDLTNLHIMYNKRGMKEANQFLRAFIVERMFASHKRLFEKWVKYTSAHREQETEQRAKVAGKFCLHVNRVDQALSLRVAFFDWKRESEYHSKMRLYKTRLVSICKFWLERVLPDVRKFLRRWRCNVVLSRPLVGVAGSESAAGADGASSSSSSSTAEAALTDMVKHAVRKMRDLPVDDAASGLVRTSVLSDALARVTSTLGNWEAAIAKARRDVAQQSKNLQMSEQTLKILFESQVGAVAGNLSKVSVTMASQINTTNQTAESFSKATAERFSSVDGRGKRAEDRLDAIEEALRAQDRKTERIMMLQGEMLERIDKLEVFQRHTISKFDKAIAESVEAKRRSQKADDSNAALKRSLEDSMIFFNSEVKSLKVFVTETTRALQTLDGKQQSAEAILESSTKNLLDRADALEAQARDFFPLPPHPADLVELCLQYERHCVDNHCMGMFSSAFPADLTQRFADFCRKFVHHIDEELEVDRFAEIVRGGGAVARKGPMGESLHLAKQRQALVDAFVDNFAVLLRESESSAPPGVVRANARVLFYRRFLRTIGAATYASAATVAAPHDATFVPPPRAQSPSSRRDGRLSSSSSSNNNGVGGVSPIRATTTSRFDVSSVGTYGVDAPPFKPPPWRGGANFLLDGDDEEKDAAPPPNVLPNTRGVLNGAGDRSRPVTAAAAMTSSGGGEGVGEQGQQRSAQSLLAQQRPHSASTGRLPAVSSTMGHSGASSSNSSSKLLGGGFRVPKEQASAQVVDELVHTFTRAVSIPLVHQPAPEAVKGQPGAEDEHALQTRRLTARASPAPGTMTDDV